MENKNLKELQEWVKCFVDERGWKNNPGDILTHMVEELGEVARNVLHMKDYGGQHTFKEDINMGEELADLMYLLLKMSNECNVDLGKSFRLKMEKKEFKSERRKIWQERFQWFIFPALLFLIYESRLSARKPELNS
mgnify:CR=1 FL=1